MIKTGKYSTFKGPICDRDCHDVPNVSPTNSIFFFAMCVSMQVTQPIKQSAVTS